MYLPRPITPHSSKHSAALGNLAEMLVTFCRECLDRVLVTFGSSVSARLALDCHVCLDIKLPLVRHMVFSVAALGSVSKCKTPEGMNF